MGKQQDEELLRITACYVAEVQAGRQPLLSNYVARYPQYAAAIADFVAYFHAIETGIRQETSLPELLSPIARQALERLNASLVQTEPGGTAPRGITSLLRGSEKRRRSPAQLAQATGLGEDIIAQLEAREVDSRTIPHEVQRRLARALHISQLTVRLYLASPPAFASGEQYADKPLQRRIAEERASYGAENQEGDDYAVMPAKSFRRVLEESAQLSPEQKAAWYTVLEQEGL